ncbi:ATP-binding cassette domain-containing protein [Bacteroides acidifaciens]|uniref:peptidase domain-containing ABC transporter n=1 Tax=Bacteroides acidifaciens TaxID=85831 RepID=UPI00214A7FF7|nr:ABC transporter transmembrane domain-containing protein [Bacteroides acidifaciens]MCR2007282.1 ATP-binding cassette domain-containing protein [Bacteroides acidifaciens]
MKCDIKHARKTFTLQKSNNLCGISCLISICKYLNLQIDECNILEKSGTVSGGTTLLGIKEAAESCDLVAEGYEGNVSDLKNCDALSILHIVNEDGFTHFIVCYGYDPIARRFVIGDPGIGIIECDDSYLEQVWKSKLLLILNCSDTSPQKKENKVSNYSYIFSILHRNKSLLLITLILSGISSLLSLTTAFFIQKLTDDILPQKNISLILYSTLLYFAILVMSAIFSYLNERMIIKHNLLFNVSILRSLLCRIFYLPYGFFQSIKTGEIISRLSDTERIQNSIILFVNFILMEGLILIVSICALFYYEYHIGVVAMLSIPPLIWLSYYYSLKIENEQKKTMAEYAKFETFSIDIISGIMAIKNGIKERLFYKRLFGIYKSTQLKRTNLKITNSNFNLYINLIIYTFSFIVILLSSYYVVINKIGIGALFAIITILTIILQTSIKIATYMISVQEAKVAYSRALLIIQHPLENYQDGSGAINLLLNNKLSIQNIAFKYPGRDLLFEKLNLTAETGELISIFGRIGTGKTTVTQLVQRYYTPLSGCITFNDKDINELVLSEWRKQINVVTQQTKLFMGTIAENISMFSAPMEKVTDFCNTMKLDWFFKNEDLRLHNIVDENGNNLSGGQKQLIGIARALYQNSPILILDEPTAAMDRECEHEVMKLLERLKQTKIIIMITHKPEIAKLSNRIYVLENRTFTNSGDPKELMKNSNLYSDSINAIKGMIANIS